MGDTTVDIDAAAGKFCAQDGSDRRPPSAGLSKFSIGDLDAISSFVEELFKVLGLI